MQITISNYRAIRADKPLTLDLSQPVTFLLGKNNIGKSSLLRFFVELKNVLAIRQDARGQKQHQIDLNPYFWDSLAHRSSLSEPMRVKIQNDGEEWEYEIAPIGDHHTNRVTVSLTPRVVRGNDTIINMAEILSRIVYFGPVRSTSYSGANGVYTAVAGSNLVSVWSDWSTGENIHHRLATEKLEDEIRQLFGFQRFTLRVSKERNEIKVSYDEGSFKLTELGDGLSHFITVLANSLVSRPSYILIDEPENGLHPKLQALFVQTLAAKCTHGLLASSHSMALARNVADTVFYCTKTGSSGLEIAAHGKFELNDIASELREMSYTQLIEAGEQNLLLVEGRTDVKVFRELLKLYNIEQRFILISLGGGDFLSGDSSRYEDELKQLSLLGVKSVTAIIDSEKAHEGASIPKERQVFQEVCTKIGYEVFIMERRAIENYVPQKAVTHLFGPNVKALGSFSSFQPGNGWKKANTWKLFSVTEKASIDCTDIGNFFATNLTRKADI